MKKIIIAAAAVIAAGCSASITPEDIKVAGYKDGKECAVTFSYDDGMKEHYTIVAPELEKRGFRGTFWLCCAWYQDDPQADTTHLTWSEIREMSDRGHEMSNHSWSHPDLTTLPDDVVKDQIVKNDDAIEKHTGIRPVTFCFPYNNHDERTVGIVMEDKIAARLDWFWHGGEHSPEEYLHNLVDEALAEGKWITSMTHGINYGYDSYKDASEFPVFLDYVKSLEDRIWVGTFREVAAYKAEAEAIRISSAQNGKAVTVTPEIDLDAKIFNSPLTMEVNTGGRKIKATQGDAELEVTYRNDKAYFSFDPYGDSIEIK